MSKHTLRNQLSVHMCDGVAHVHATAAHVCTDDADVVQVTTTNTA